MHKKDKVFMQRCIELAQKGLGNTYPNPLVGCVIVKNDEIIAEGWHKKAGAAHAEVDAIQKVINKSILKECTLFVNLEPCSHFGKTPPCTDLIIEMGIPNIVIGCQDSNEKVSGKGIKKLIEAGCNVITGVLEKKCQTMNQRFFTFHEKKRPYIILKWAESKDGFMAPKNPEKDYWLTHPHSRQRVHQWRSEEQAILVGSQTVLNDDPNLSTRLWFGKNPIRFAIDPNHRIPKKSNLNDGEITTFFLVDENSDRKSDNNIISAEKILESLYKKNIQSVIIEGGAKTLEFFIENKIWDVARVFKTNKNLNDGLLAPKIEGELKSRTTIQNDILFEIYSD